MGKFGQARTVIQALKQRAVQAGRLVGLDGRPLHMNVSKTRPILPPEGMLHYWHPHRTGVTRAPEAFQRQIQAVSPDLAVVRAPSQAPIPTGPRWCVWVRNPRITFWACPGWQLVLIWAHPVTGEELPLNELLFHNLHVIDKTKYGRARDYFDRIEQDMARQKASREAEYETTRKDLQHDWITSRRISNVGAGSKFARHHDGTIVPSQGHQTMMDETRKWRLPSEMLKQMARDQERARG